MERPAPGVPVPALATQGRVIKETEVSALLKLIRANRAMLNTMETMIEDVFLNRVVVPVDKEIVIATKD